MKENHTKQKGVYNTLYEELYASEYEAILDEGWLHNNDSKEACVYALMTDAHKELYAHYHATWYVNKVMQWSLEEFEAYFEDQFKGIYCEAYAQEMQAYFKDRQDDDAYIEIY